jgi:hypothetical protein
MRKGSWRIAATASAVVVLLAAAAALGLGDVGSYKNEAPTPRLNTLTVSGLLTVLALLGFLVYSWAHPRSYWQGVSACNIVVRILITLVVLAASAFVLVGVDLAMFFVL